MIPVKFFGKWKNPKKHLLAVVLLLPFLAGIGWGQVTGSITGTVTDASGAVVPGATLTIKHMESGLTRTTESNLNGGYTVPSLPVGPYELTAEKPGFKQQVRSGINLVVGQQAVVNLTLEVGNVQQVVEVSGEAPIVNTTLNSTSGLVGEKEVKDLPLNGRSFDQLLTLNVGTVNYTSNSSLTGNLFSVAGRREEENRFLMNGVDYVGADSSQTVVTPTGASGKVLGVDAVREFNLVQHTYGAEYGKRAGGQVSVVTTSGTNQLHGDAFEYLRNSVLDARNFFDRESIKPFKRNQFGGALGGPLKHDKAFLFGNYEGFRQRLGISSVAVVPNAQARQGLLPCNLAYAGPNVANACPDLGAYVPVPNLQRGMLPLFAYWPDPNGPELGGGLAYNYSSPAQKNREEFGLVRFDDIVSPNDSFSANYLIDDGENELPQDNPIFVKPSLLRSQVLSLQETRVFSPTVLNVATLGFSRANSRTAVHPTVPIPESLWFITGTTAGSITIGGGGGGGFAAASAVTLATGVNPTWSVRNYFTGSDDAHYVKGNHSWSVGVWVQRIQQNVSAAPSFTAGGSPIRPCWHSFKMPPRSLSGSRI